MQSTVVQRIAQRTPRKSRFHVSAYAKMLLSGTRQRFHYYFSWKQFELGLGFCKTTGLSGWKYMFSIELGPLSVWIYFNKI